MKQAGERPALDLGEIEFETFERLDERAGDEQPFMAKPRANSRGCSHNHSALAGEQRTHPQALYRGRRRLRRRVLYLAFEGSRERGHDAEWFANIKARTGSTELKSIERALKAKKWD